MKLLIVESPGKVKKIQSYLGSGWQVMASVGHIRDLPVKEIGVCPPDFKPQYAATDRGRKVIADLRRAAEKADSVCLATDPDREGEAIAWHLMEALGLKNPERVTYTEITEKAVKAALAKPRPIDMNLVRAQEGRRVLDRLVGYSVSPAAAQAGGQVFSAGRVQTPALRLVVEREEAIRNFRQTTHFGAELHFDRIPDISPGWKAVWQTKDWLAEGQEYFLDKSAAEKIAALRKLEVFKYEEGEAKIAPPAPFTTSTLQQAASNSLKMDPKETMELAQSLYEDGHISYMRTDSPNLSTEAIDDIRALASKKNWPVPAAPRTWQSKAGAQEAHEAIRPTHTEAEKAGGNEREEALYKLIRLRAIASQLEDAVMATVRAVLKTGLEGREVIFEAKGRRLLSPGWKTVTSEDQAEEDSRDKDKDELNNPVPRLREGSEVQAAAGEVRTKKTAPPPRFTQASLIRDLEKRGIGRPSTYASIMNNITARAYIKANPKRQLEATALGLELIGLLRGSFEFLDCEYTKNMEEKLDRIAQGKADYLTLVRSVNAGLERELSSFKAANTPKCPDCGTALRHLVKSGPNGYNFWACTDWENCGAKFQDDKGKPGQKQKPPQLSEHKCTVCGKPLRHIVREGPGGYDFWGCSGRECRAAYKDDGGKPGRLNVPKDKQPPSEFKCKSCKSPLCRRQGHSRKTGKDYDFFACSNKKCGKTYPAKDGRPNF